MRETFLNLFDQKSVGAATEKKGLSKNEAFSKNTGNTQRVGVGIIIISIIIIIIIIMIIIIIIIIIIITVKRSLPSVSHPYKARRKQANEPVWLIG